MGRGRKNTQTSAVAHNVFVVEFAGALPTTNLSHVKTRFKGSKKMFGRISPSKLNHMLWTAARAVASARGQADPKSGREGVLAIACMVRFCILY